MTPTHDWYEPDWHEAACVCCGLPTKTFDDLPALCDYCDDSITPDVCYARAATTGDD